MTIRPGGAVPPAAGRRPGTRATFLWALTPLFTIGLATWAVFLYAAIRRRSWWLGGAAAGYAVLLAVSLATTSENSASAGEAISTVALLACMVGGCAHAFAVRGRVFGTQPPSAGDRLHAAEHEALQRRKLREEARAVITRDPALARELGIGRPDLRRDYDDGGLVDVNHAPAAILASLPGMTPELAAKAVELRGTRGGFVSADDLSLALGMQPGEITSLADVTVYPG
jgi:DNA uptake protein ComE-like DNA-binding protein